MGVWISLSRKRPHVGELVIYQTIKGEFGEGIYNPDNMIWKEVLFWASVPEIK